MDPIGWLRAQDRAFQAVVVGGVGLVAVVTLVVGVAVAVVIGGMAFADGGGSQPSAPSAEFTTDADGDAVTITTERGDDLPAGEVYVELDHGHEGHVHREAWADRTGLAHDEPIPSGSTVTVRGVQPGDAVRVVYRPTDEGPVLVEYVA